MVHFAADAGTESEGLASKGFASLAWQPTEATAGQTQEIINPTQALPSQEAWLALVIKRSYPHELPVPSVEGSTLLPSVLRLHFYFL